ncbi:MAG: FHA domain-containing protein [Myxococcota bacterium]
MAARGPAPSPAGGVPPTVVSAAPQAPAAGARLVSILKDGSDGQAYPIAGEQHDVGREEGDVVLRDDPYLSPRHARIRCRDDTFVLQDLDSANGVYLRIRQPVDLSNGDMILIGQEVLRFDVLPDGELPLGPAMVHGVMLFGTPETPRIARLVQYTTEGVGRDVFYLYRDETVLGRETGDIVFTDDPFLSRRHASVTVDRAGGRFVLRDLGSSNGTAIRIRGEHVLEDGDQFRMGRHLFRFDRGGPEGRHPGHE